MIPKRLLAALAPYNPMSQDELGGCNWCGGTPPGQNFSNAERFLEDHRTGCPWVKARRLLGDQLPVRRETFTNVHPKKEL